MDETPPQFSQAAAQRQREACGLVMLHVIQAGINPRQPQDFAEEKVETGREFLQQFELGLLHFEIFLYWRGVAVIQYWRTFEQLHAYAHARNAKHLPAWAEFNRRIGGNGSVGIWHETYTVNPGQHESIYANMPKFGLAAAVQHTAVTSRSDTARARISP